MSFAFTYYFGGALGFVIGVAVIQIVEPKKKLNVMRNAALGFSWPVFLVIILFYGIKGFIKDVVGAIK